MNYQTMTLANREYVLVPKQDFLSLTKGQRVLPDSPANDPLAGAVPAVPFAMKSIGRQLFAARAVAGLTQAALAKKLACSQTMVSLAEKGRKHVGVEYVRRVLRACRLPKDWRSVR
jgi:hypothetical protein